MTAPDNGRLPCPLAWTASRPLAAPPRRGLLHHLHRVHEGRHDHQGNEVVFTPGLLAELDPATYERDCHSAAVAETDVGRHLDDPAQARCREVTYLALTRHTAGALRPRGPHEHGLRTGGPACPSPTTGWPSTPSTSPG